MFTLDVRLLMFRKTRDGEKSLKDSLRARPLAGAALTELRGSPVLPPAARTHASRFGPTALQTESSLCDSIGP